MAGILGGYPQQPGILGAGPQVPWGMNPLVTMAGISLLGGRTLNEGLRNFAQAAPYAMQAKTQVQDRMLAAQEKQAAQAQDAQRNAALNAWIKAKGGSMGLTAEDQALIASSPELGKMMFGESVKQMFATPEKGTDDMREYDLAVSQGYDGTFQDYMVAMKRAGAATTNIDNIGTIPQGYELVQDPDTGAKRMAPIPGGPADTTKADQAAGENQRLKGDIVIQDIDRTLGTIERIPNSTTGIGGAILKNVPGSGAANVSALMDSVKANVGFEQLQAMRAASPTGGALGAVSERENALLQSVLGSLEQSQDQGQLVFNLKRLKNIYLDIVHGPGAGPAREQLDAGVAGGQAAGSGDVVDWQTYFGTAP